MKRSLDQVHAEAAGAADDGDGGSSNASSLPGSPFVPSLLAWGVVSSVSSEQQQQQQLVERVQTVLVAPLSALLQEAALLSRRDRALLRASPSHASSVLVSPVMDGERFVLVLDKSVPALVVGETGRVQTLQEEAAVLMGYLEHSKQERAFFEVVFVFSPKGEEFVMVVQDCLSIDPPNAPLSTRREQVASFIQFCQTKKEELPFEIMEQRFEPLSALPKLLSSIMWHEETSSRVLMHGDFRLAVLGIRIAPASSPYVFGGTNLLVLDWFFPRQHVFLSRLFVLPGSNAITFGFRDAAAGMLVLNPAHVPATIEKLGECEGSCICKVMFDPVKGLYNVRSLYAPGERRLSTAAQAFAISMQANEAINKEELLSWISGAPHQPQPHQQHQKK